MTAGPPTRLPDGNPSGTEFLSVLSSQLYSQLRGPHLPRCLEASRSVLWQLPRPSGSFLALTWCFLSLGELAENSQFCKTGLQSPTGRVSLPLSPCFLPTLDQLLCLVAKTAVSNMTHSRAPFRSGHPRESSGPHHPNSHLRSMLLAPFSFLTK